MWVVIQLGVLVALAVSVFQVPAALAGICGGAVPCQCGDTVTSDYTMTGGLGPCSGHGLVLTSNVALDCQGFSVVGLGNGSEQYGIYLHGDTGAEVTGVTVERCEVSRFLRGIRLRAAEQNVILDNFLHGNGDFTAHVGYGIDVAMASKNNLFQGNTIAGNADEGIHFGSNTGPNRFVDNELFDNFREQIYVLSSDGNTFIGNTTSGSGSNSLYLKDSNGNHLEGNTFKDRITKVIGDSSDNVFVNNTFVNSLLQFTVYQATPDRIPRNNAVSGGSMTNPSGTCLRFTNTTGNVVSDVALNGCGTQVRSESTAAEPSRNVLVSMPLISSKVSAEGPSSTLSVGWWLELHVQDAAGVAVPGARVQALDAGGRLVFDVLTDSGGKLPTKTLLQYVRTGPSIVTATPHTLNASKSGYLPDIRVLQAVQDLGVTVVLTANSPPPEGGSGSFSDDFNRLVDSTVLGNGWVEVQGDLVIDRGELKNNSALKGNHVAVLPALSGGDQSAASDFASANNNAIPRFGIVLRFQDARNYYLLYRLVGGTSVVRIAKVVNGVETVLASVAVANPIPNRFFHLGGQVKGSTLTLDLDGTRKLSVADYTFAGGSVGILLGSYLASGAHRADHFSATLP